MENLTEEELREIERERDLNYDPEREKFFDDWDMEGLREYDNNDYYDKLEKIKKELEESNKKLEHIKKEYPEEFKKSEESYNKIGKEEQGLEEKDRESKKEMEEIEKEYKSYKNLEFKKWKEIPKEKKEELLKNSKIDKYFYKDNRVLIEFENGLSIIGKSEKNGNIKIDDKEILSLINEKSISENSVIERKNGIKNLITEEKKGLFEKIKESPLLRALKKQKVLEKNEKEQGR